MYLQLDKIEHFGSIFMLPKEVARIMQVDFKELISDLNDEFTEVSKAYFSGHLSAEVKIRESAVSEDVNPDIVTMQLQNLTRFKAQLQLQLSL